MSQKNQSDCSQKGLAVGRGLLAAAETLNFNMSGQHSGPASRAMGGMGGGGDGQDSRRGSHLASTMKLFASLGLSPADLDALAQIPEDNISVETLPRILMQLKSRKGNLRELPSMSSNTSYQGGKEDWDDVQMDRMGGSSMGQASARSQDFGYGSMQDTPAARGYNLGYGGGAGSRERPYSELSQRESYGALGMGPSPPDSVFMQRRMGSPSHGKVQDFLGVMPSMFPHVCSLCDFDVHSIMEWNQHTNGIRHAENRRLLLEMYPDWDPGMASNRSIPRLLDAPNLAAGLLGPAPMTPGHAAGGMASGWGGGGPGLPRKNQSLSGPKVRSRVVVTKYERKPLSNKSLFSLTEQFGCLREHLVLKNKAFLEMETHQEALAMVNYYRQHPASLYGKPITFYLSKELMVIEQKGDRLGDRPGKTNKGHGSQVIFFSNLPREEEKKKELLTIAGRFGTVEKHLFLTEEAFVQLGTPEDADMMVKYYNVNPLTIKGRPIRFNICTKYKTLNVSRRLGQGSTGGNGRGRKGSGVNTSVSGTKNSSKSTSSSSSKTKEQKKKEEAKPTAEEKPVSEEEVAGVMDGEGGGEAQEVEMQEEGQGKENQAADEEGKKEEEEDQTSTLAEEREPAESNTETVQETGNVSVEKVPDGDDITKEADGVGGAKSDAKQEAELEGQDGPMDTEAYSEKTKAKDEPTAEPGESSEMNEGDLSEDLEDQDFLENMDNFVTLDELAEDEDDSFTKSDLIDNSRRGGMRVVNIVGFRRGANFLNELLALAKPFGEVVKHLVLDLRPEAYLQFSTEDEAKAMATFYSSNIVASVCGRSVRISHSMTYPTIQCGSSRVVYIGQLPNTKYSDENFLKLAEPFGKVRKYFTNRIKREGFIEMENAEDAEKMADVYKTDPPKFQGRRLTVYVSRKYKQLKYGHRLTSLDDKKTSKRDSSGTTVKSSKHTDEPPAKKAKEAEEAEKEKDEEKEEIEEEESAEATNPDKKSEEDSAEKETTPEVSDQPSGSENQKSSDELKPEAEAEAEMEAEASARQNGQTQEAVVVAAADIKPSVASLPLAPYDPNEPIGVEHVRMGYYCRVCFLFYSNEETAKRVHCSSQAHYDKLKKHLEKEQAKAPGSKQGRKSSA